MDDATIAEQQATAEVQENDQEVSPQPFDQSTNAVDGTQIPQKFVGKSLDDVMSAYQEVESYAGRLASEKAQAEKERLELEERVRELETRYQQTQHSQPQVQQEPELDPFQRFDEVFDEDPKQAIREALQATQQSLKKETAKQRQERLASEANDYYHRQKQENPDYSRREKLMQNLVGEYADLFKPDMLNSVKALKFLDIASKGTNLDYYEKQAIERSKKDGLSMREEKRAAHSINSASEGEQSTNFSDLSLEEMQKLLGYADK